MFLITDYENKYLKMAYFDGAIPILFYTVFEYEALKFKTKKLALKYIKKNKIRDFRIVYKEDKNERRV